MANRLDVLLTQSLEQLNDAASGDSLCTLSGVNVQAAKYLEGTVVALKNLKRELRETPSENLTEIADRVGLYLIQQLPPGYEHNPSWHSYAAGAKDAIEQFRAISGR